MKSGQGKKQGGNRRGTARLNAYVESHKDDPAYRQKRDEGSRRYQLQLQRDARLGRMTRIILKEVETLLATVKEALNEEGDKE